VVALSLRGEETTDTHGDGASDELCHPSEDDQLGFTERRETSCQGEWDSKTIGKTNNNITNNVGINEGPLVVLKFFAANPGPSGFMPLAFCRQRCGL